MAIPPLLFVDECDSRRKPKLAHTPIGYENLVIKVIVTILQSPTILATSLLAKSSGGAENFNPLASRTQNDC